MVVEIAMFAIGVWLCGRATCARDAIGRYAFLGYLPLLLAVDTGDRFGGPPASAIEVAGTGLIADAILLAYA